MSAGSSGTGSSMCSGTRSLSSKTTGPADVSTDNLTNTMANMKVSDTASRTIETPTVVLFDKATSESHPMEIPGRSGAISTRATLPTIHQNVPARTGSGENIERIFAPPRQTSSTHWTAIAAHVNRSVRLKRQHVRDQAMCERRKISCIAPSGTQSPSSGNTFDQQLDALLPAIVNDLRAAGNLHNANAVRMRAAQQLRKLLSHERSPPVAQVVATGILPDLLRFMLADDLPGLQFETAWCLTNLASDSQSHAKLVIEAGGVPAFIHLLKSNDVQTVEQAVWGLGNVAGTCAEYRDLILAANCLPPLLEILRTTERVSLLRNATWTLSNICRGKPAVDMCQVKEALPIFKSLIYRADREVLIDICWGLSYLTDGENEKIQAVLDLDITKRLVNLLKHESLHVVTPALRTIGNIATGEDHQTQQVLNCGALPALKELLTNEHAAIRKETCWTLSNITAGTTPQVQLVFDEDILPILVKMASTEPFRTQKEAVWALANLTSGASPAHIEHIVSLGVLDPLVCLLGQEDRLAHVILECLDNVLKTGQSAGQRKNPYAK
ncbi:hypothetical protein, variant [Sphaeroforma arctica JP610]|uniref:Importin subunit alpha n=1 Tax=Sphaeroforma arctica JP610 TaxID=667725 RepID=A0A0L0G8I8_9EUKA|nr:hypothetical protein, variant [Sphaeroforma arctica JP610]KNC85315.1 hypothetical protein, variant [Sphaeroforma arctica JP610]|eukprot:XP_014159217.1 hypothetical protein, variant [Sphaeroforma arctica JP610]